MEREPINLLLVDDRKENLIALEAILRGPQYCLISVTSGNEALQIAMREPIAVILLDVLMPDMDGFEVAQHLKQLERTRNIPILFLTAQATQVREIYHAYDVGAVDYLIKPLDPEVVRKKVAVYIDLVGQRQEIERQGRLLREAERREYELRLAELRVASDRRYRKVIDGIDHAVGWNAEGETLRLTFLSRQAERVLGYRGAQLADTRFWEKCIHPDDRQEVLTAFHRAMADGLDLAFDHRMVAADGRVLWFHSCVSGEKARAGQPAQLDGVSIDVTELKRAEATQALFADAGSILGASLDAHATLPSLARRLVPDLADWCVIDEVVGPDTVRQVAEAHVDPAAAARLRELARLPTLDPRVPGGVAEVLHTGRPQLHREVRDLRWLTDALGVETTDWIIELGAVSCMFVPIAARERTLAVATFVSSASPRHFGAADLELAQEVCRRAAVAMDNALLFDEAQRATETREEVLAIVSHDLRSPLSSIKISAKLLETTGEGAAGSARARRSLQSILRAVERMERLIGDLLDFGRMEAGQLVIERRAVDAAALVCDGVELVRPLAEQKRVQLESHPGEHLDVSCDRDRTLQIISNLLGNAIKFTPANGRVGVRAERAEGEVRFAVFDSGPGISAEQLPHVWERFWRADRTDKAGIGLGLAIAKWLVEAQGGRVWAESRIGVGSTFWFTLPMQAGAAGQAAPRP
jgi:PAS domain S-box-containing protein